MLSPKIKISGESIGMVAGGKITAITVGAHNETPGISDPAIAQVPAAIIREQPLDVDVVSGATITSQVIMKAVAAALSGTQDADTATLPFEKPDVLVVGGGLAGLTASIQAAELGANVIVFEQSGTVGGSGRFAGGYVSGAVTEMQKEAGIEDSFELFYADLVRIMQSARFPTSC